MVLSDRRVSWWIRQKRRRLTLVVVAGVVALAVIGVEVYRAVTPPNSGEGAGSSAQRDSQTTVITDMALELDLTWSPPESLPSANRVDITDALARYGVHALFPSRAPSVVTGPLLGRFWLTRTVPANRVGAHVFVTTEAGQPVISVTSGESTWIDSEDWSAVAIRGMPGRFERNSAGLTFLTWEEGGRFYSVEFGDRLTLDQAAAWLVTWETVPD